MDFVSISGVIEVNQHNYIKNMQPIYMQQHVLYKVMLPSMKQKKNNMGQK